MSVCNAKCTVRNASFVVKAAKGQLRSSKLAAIMPSPLFRILSTKHDQRIPAAHVANIIWLRR